MAGKKARIISFVMTRYQNGVMSRASNTEAMHKKNQLDLVSMWWACNGTGFNDYDALNIKVVESWRKQKNGD